MKEILSPTDSTSATTADVSPTAYVGVRSETTPKHVRGSAPMMKRMLAMLGFALLFILAIGAFKAWQIRTGIAMAAQFAPPPAAVTSAVAKAERWQPVLSAVGSLRAVNGVTVSTDLAGIISQI